MPAAPALVPSVPALRVGGEDRRELAPQLLSLAVREDSQGLFRCEAELGNWGAVEGRIGFRYFDRRVLDFGRDFEVRLGDATLFRGRILGLRAEFPEGGPPRLVVLADDRLQELRMTRRTRTFADVSDADVVRSIASDHSLRAEVDVQGPTHRLLAQVNQSDLAFLRERARAVDAEVWVEGDTLHVVGRASRDAGTVELVWQHQLREFSVTADLATQRTAVVVGGWDVAAAEAIRAEAAAGAIAAEVGSDVSGVSILEGLGARSESVAHAAPATTAEAQAAADAFFRMGARRFVTGHGVAEASTALRVGRRVDLRGLGPLFNGRYAVTAVLHRFDTARGIRTEFDVERPGIGRPA